MKRSLLVLLLVPTIFFVPVSISHARYTITQITDNDYYELAPQINNNGEAVWSRLGDSYTEIFLYDGTSTTQLTNDDHSDHSPQINDNGYVVWLTHPPHRGG
jgi:hypothetical protein